MLSRKFAALAFFVALGSCNKASENPRQPSLEETVKVVWPNNTEVKIENKKHIWLFGERVAVKYTLNKGTWREESEVKVDLRYIDRNSGPIYIHVIDSNNDGRAERVWTISPDVDIRRDEAEQPTRIFHHADLVLDKLRKELRVDEVLKLGPNGLFDPFTQKP